MENTRDVTVGWFEIPTIDMDRAIKFYETVFNTKLSRNTIGDFDMAWFPWNEEAKGSGGSLVNHKEYTPTSDGTLIYFSSENVDNELSRIETAGGKILTPKTQISPEIGFMALFVDSEGNRIALHSRN